VVVYTGRSVQVTEGESLHAVVAGGVPGSNNLTISWNGTKPALRRGSWILDVTRNPITNVVASDFYRVVNTDETVPGATSGQIALETQTTLKENTNPINNAPINANRIVVMENVVEVLYRGSGWQP
jgi:hypothetical protein